MWEEEAELRHFIKQKLEELGHTVRSEVRISRFWIDLVSEKEEAREPIDQRIAVQVFPEQTRKVIRAIVVKLHNRREIYNALSRCMNLSYLPQIDEVYLAIPKLHFTREIQEHLKNMPVGTLITGEQQIKMNPPPWNRKPPTLRGGGSHPTSVSPGDEFEISVSARNDGEKDAPKVKFEWTPAGPFRRPTGEKNKKSIRRLEPHQSVSMPFKVKARSDAKPGKYPIFTKISADGVEARSSLFEITIRAQEKGKS